MPKLRTFGLVLILAATAVLELGVSAKAQSPEDESALDSLDRVTIGAFMMSVNPAYLEAASSLPNVERSYYRRCDLVSYENELMAARSATNASDWHQIGRCRMSYAGDSLPRLFRLDKDELVKSEAFGAKQFPNRVKGNDFVYRRFTSKPGYFSRTPPRLKPWEVVDYYTQGQGAGVSYPDGSFHWTGPYLVNVVDQDHIMCAYGVWWTSGNVVGSADFSVISDRIIGPGVHCDGSLVGHKLN